MNELNEEIIKLVTKYPFLTDPIVLFNPSEIPSKEDILSGKLHLEYPEIDKLLGNIEILKQDFFAVNNKFIKTRFLNKYIEVEHQERLKDFYKVIRIIEIFHKTEEYEKYNLINEYFGIDFELLEEIFENKEILKSGFPNKKPLLSKKQIKKLTDRKINAQDLKFYFDEALKSLKLDTNWNVIIGDVISVVHTNFDKNGGEIIIPKTYQTNAKRLLELIAHEIDGHCVQFTNCDFLSSGTIRYSQSESLVEGFAMYTEYLFGNTVFGAKKEVQNLYKRNKNRFLILNKEKEISYIFDALSGTKIRYFRGFSDIKRYMNLKDFVYLQGVYKVLKYSKKYSNTFSLLKSGAINKSYIKKFGKKRGRKEKINIKKTSAYYILDKYFTK